MSDVVLMLGAGASRDAELPDVKELVETFLTRDDLDHIDLAKGICQRLSTVEPVVDIEHLLSTLDQLEDRSKQGLSAFTKPDGWEEEALQDPAVYSELRVDLYRHIRERLHLERDAAHYYDFICDLADLHGGIDIFSLNYDLAVELACLNTGTSYTDGFDPAWNPSLFDETSRFPIRLHKLHGSLLWHRLDTGVVEKVAVSPRRNQSVVHFSGSPLTEALVYPAAAGKDVHADPYATLVERFRSSLREATILVVIGYSFRDGHIKTAVTEALAHHQPLRLMVVDPTPSQMLSRSDELTPTRFSFRDLEDRIHPIPLGGADALMKHEVRDGIPRVRSIENLERERDDTRRRENRSNVLGNTARLVRDSLNQRFGYHLGQCASGMMGDDYDSARTQLMDRRDETAETLIAPIALACSPDPEIQAAGRASLNTMMQILCRGVVIESADGSKELIYSDQLDEAFPRRGNGESFWQDRSRRLYFVLDQLRTMHQYTAYHLDHLGDTYAKAMDSVLADLELALSFFDTCIAAPTFHMADLLVVTHTPNKTQYRGVAHPSASDLMKDIGTVWADGQFPRALTT